jgi:hypothetical protein
MHLFLQLFVIRLVHQVLYDMPLRVAILYIAILPLSMSVVRS